VGHQDDVPLSLRYYDDDRTFAQMWVIGERMIGQPADKRQAAMTAFNDRQVGRMAMSAAPSRTSPIIEESTFVCST